MSLTKKNTSRRTSVKRLKNKKTIIVTKSKSKEGSAFAKKIKAMDILLGKAKLLS